jgi:hypothetical protein
MESPHAQLSSQCFEWVRDYPRAGRGHATPSIRDVQIIAWQCSTVFPGNASFVPEPDTSNPLGGKSLEGLC